MGIRFTNQEQRNLYLSVFTIVALLMISQKLKLPNSIDWQLFIFISIMAILDRINIRVFSTYHYSFFNVILGLIIFDHHSSFYGLIYILADYLYCLIRNKTSIKVLIPSASINIIILLISNDFYKIFTDKSHLARYLTLVIILVLNISFSYIYFYLSTKEITTKHLLNIFGPVLFELVVVFPILAHFKHLNVNFILSMYLLYYFSIGYLHTKFINTNDEYIRNLATKIEDEYHIRVSFMDLGKVKGIYRPSKKAIIIDNKIDYPEQLQALIHEILHFKISKCRKIPKYLNEFIIILFEALISWYLVLTMKTNKEKLVSSGEGKI